MKKVVLVTAVAVVLAALMTGCGGGSSTSGKKIATNDVLGDMPNLVYQKAYVDSVLYADRDAQKSKLKGTSKSDFEKSAKISENYKKRSKEEDEKFEANVEKIKSTLIGKDIPFEMADGIGYEVNYCKISELKYGVNVEFEVTLTNESVIRIYQWGTLSFYYQVLDKDGNVIGKDYYGELRNAQISMSQKNGETAKGNLYLVSKEDAAQMANFAKIRFVEAPPKSY